MVKSDSFSFFSSPLTAKKTGNDTFNESFAEKNSFSPLTILRTIQSEHDKICSVIKNGHPSPSQYQNSLNELISLFERCNEESTTNMQKIVLSVFLKLCANILSVLKKKTFQQTLYRLAQIIAHSISAGDEEENEKRTLTKWADRITYECSIHFNNASKSNIDFNFNNDQIIDDLSLSNGRFQFVRTAIFESAKDLVLALDKEQVIDPFSSFRPEYLGEEHFLQLLLWNYKKRGVFVNESFLEDQFANFSSTPNAENVLKSDPSFLDVKLFLVSLSVLASNTTDCGNTAKEEPSTASQLTITKIQRECWKGVVNMAQGASPSALFIRRVWKMVDAVRLTDSGSEDVRVLFEAWKKCLQPSTAMDEDVYQAVKQVAEIYRTKINSILANGVFYTSGSVSSLIKTTWERRQEVPTVFPLQFDYQFVDTDEAGHIGTIINSTEGYVRIEMSDVYDTEEEYDIVDQNEFESEEDVVESSFTTAPEKNESYQYDTADDSQFFSPLKHNRHSMMPESIGKLIRDESQANTSMVSTKSVIMTPSRDKTPKKTTPVPLAVRSPFGHEEPTTPTKPGSSQKWTEIRRKPFASSGDAYEVSSGEESYDDGEKDEDEEDEEDNLEAALLQSSKRHETSKKLDDLNEKKPVSTPQKGLFGYKTPVKVEEIKQEEEDIKPIIVQNTVFQKPLQPKQETPKKDAQTETDVPKLEMSPPRQTSISPKQLSLSKFVDLEIEKDSTPLLTPEEESQLIDKLLEASTRMLRDIRLQKTGIPHEKIDTDKMNDDEIWDKIDKKVLRCQADLKTAINRLATLTIKKEVKPILIGKAYSTLDHPSEKCLGCQPESMQEAALRCLESMALRWDAEGQSKVVRELKL